MDFNTFVPDVFATVFGGALLTVIFFWIRERMFGLPDLAGQWFFEMETIKSDYNPYKGMVLRYVAMVWREGNSIEGTVEKVYENSSNGEREFTGTNRTRGIVRGHIEKRYFSSDKVFLHVVEDGHGRESTNVYDLAIDSKKKMSGTFASMVAGQRGETKWQRKPF